MKRLILFLSISFLFLTTLLAYSDDARFTVSGRVTDQLGAALPGATVVLEKSYLGTSTGLDGSFEIRGVRQGDYLIRISYMGYETVAEPLKVDKNVIADYQLMPATIVADEIVVKGTRAGSQTPVTYTEINRGTIEKLNFASDIPYLLTMVPSLVETSESGSGIGYTNFRIRGSDPSRINVTIDGIPLNDAESQQVFWVDLPDLAGSISDIQVQRGVGTSTNGAGAFGASVNLRTDNPSETPYAAFSSTYGSFNTIKASVKAGTGLLGNRFMFDLRLSGLQSDGYVDRSGSRHTSVFATGVYKLRKGRIKANLIHGNEVTGISWWGIPYDSLETNRTFNPAGMYTDMNGETKFYHNQIDNYTQTHTQLIFNWQFNKNLYLNAAGHFTRGLGYYEQYKEEQALADYGLPTIRIEGFYPVFITHTDLIRRKWMYNYYGGMVFNLHYNSDRLNLTLGGGGNRYIGDHFGRLIWMRNSGTTEKDYRWYLNGATKDDFNLYGKINYHAGDRVTIYGDLQYRFINYGMSGFDDDLRNLYMDKTYNFFNPKAGIYYRISSNHQAYLSVSVANREPTRADFKDAAGDSTATPLPERMIDFEAGYKYSSSITALGVNLYYMTYHNQLVPTGELSNVGYPVMTNVESSYRAGIEMTAGIKPVERLEINGNITLSRNIIKDYTEYYIDYITATDEELYLSKYLGDVNIAYSPAIVAASDIGFKISREIAVHLVSKYVGFQNFDNTSNSVRALNPYFVNSMRIDCELPVKKLEKMELQLLVNNLFNTEYISNAYGGNYYIDGEEYSWASYYPQAGINWLARLTVRF